MTPVVFVWIKFAICAALIAVAGPLLVRYGDIIARHTGLSRNWIGLILLATATSLPELFTGLSAVAVVVAPNIAVGDVFGSCVFNLAILVVVDAIDRGPTIYSRIDRAHVLTAGFGIVMISFAGASILISQTEPWLKFYHIGLYTPILVLIYVVAMRALFVYERRQPAPIATNNDHPDITLAAAIARYLAAAGVVVAAGTWLPFIGTEMADVMGWRTTFVGTLLVAGATSLPELVVTIGALRLGVIDMAIANLLGSNLFDLFILAIDDLAYRPGPLLAAVSPAHAVTAFAAVMMSGIVIIALLYRPATRLGGTVSWASLSLLIVYLLSAYAIYMHGL